MTTHTPPDPATATPKDIISSVVSIQKELASHEAAIQTAVKNIHQKSALISPLLSGLRTRFGVTQAEINSPDLAKTLVAKLESGKEPWSDRTVEEYLSALNRIISERAEAFKFPPQL